jgi:hypothetical protein
VLLMVVSLGVYHHLTRADKQAAGSAES